MKLFKKAMGLLRWILLAAFLVRVSATPPNGFSSVRRSGQWLKVKNIRVCLPLKLASAVPSRINWFTFVLKVGLAFRK